MSPPVPPDFVITVLGLNADGVFAFTVANHGNAVTQPFKVSVYLDGYLRETVQFNIRGDLNGGRFATPTTLHGEKLRSGCRRVL